MAVMRCFSAILSLATFACAQQGAYKVWLEGVSPCGSDSNPLVNISTLKVSHHNRTSLEIKGAAVLLTTIDEEATMRMIGFKKNFHGTWSKVLDTKTVKICEMIKKDKTIWPSIVDITDIPAECPIVKGSYRINYPYLKMKNMPALLPIGCYRVEAQGDSGQLKSCNYIFVKVTMPNEGPNPRCSS